jgi:hypothetical protein
MNDDNNMYLFDVIRTLLSFCGCELTFLQVDTYCELISTAS